MTYEKKTWVDDEVIERLEIQNIEDGIDTAHDNIDSHIADNVKHLTSAQNDAVDGANAPSISNVFATLLDIALVIDDTVYNESTWNGDTDAASKNAIRDKIVDMDSDIAVNTTHKTSDGSDHTFIDQDITIDSSPTLVGTNVTAVPATSLEFLKIGSPTYYNAQDWINIVQSASVISGFTLDNSRASAELDVASGEGLVKITDSGIGITKPFSYAGTTNLTLVDNNTNYIYIDYNAGTPVAAATTSLISVEQNRHVMLGRVYKEGSTLTILNAPVNAFNLARTEYDRLLAVYGFQHASGAVVSESGTLKLAVTAGSWYMGHVPISTGALDTNVADTFKYMYYNGGTWVTDNPTATTIDYDQYDSGAALASLTVNKYGVHWVYILQDSSLYVIYGTGDYTLTLADDAQPPTSIPGIIDGMGELLAKIIVKQDGTLISIESAFDLALSLSGTVVHNESAGLQGGAANEYYHATAAEYTILGNTSGTNTGNETATTIASLIVGVAAKATPVDADTLPLIDSADSSALKEVTWQQMKATLKTYTDTLYAAKGANSDITSLTGLTTDLSIAQGGTGQSTAQAAIDALSAVSGATDEYVFTKDTASGNATWKVAATGGSDTVRIWLTPGNCDLPATNPPELRYVAASTTIPEYQVLSFDDAGTEIATWLVPVSDVATNARVIIYWSPRTTATATVDWDISMEGIANGEDIKTNSPSTSYTRLSDTASSSTNNLFIIENVSIATNCADSELMRVAIRMADVDTDGDRDLVGILIEYVAV